MRGLRLTVVAGILLVGAFVVHPASACVSGTPPAAQAGAADVDWTRAQAYDVILT